MGGFEVRNIYIENLLRDLGRKIKSLMPEGWGFTLMIFNFGDKGNMFYISSAERKDMVEAMNEFIERNK